MLYFGVDGSLLRRGAFSRVVVLNMEPGLDAIIVVSSLEIAALDWCSVSWSRHDARVDVLERSGCCEIWSLSGGCQGGSRRAEPAPFIDVPSQLTEMSFGRQCYSHHMGATLSERKPHAGSSGVWGHAHQQQDVVGHGQIASGVNSFPRLGWRKLIQCSAL